MLGFNKFMNLTAQRKCPEGYRFDEKLKVCVPKFNGRGYYGFGAGRPSTDTSTDSEADNGADSNGNGNGGNGNGGNGGNGGGE